jgi:Fe-S-cluster-containing dehydrogenase component/anaerobic selenocysteine-containing dehydrogenase
MDEITRRAFLAIAAGTGALAAGSGEKAVQKLIPYLNPPENTVPGEWSFFATTCRECPAGCGLHLWHMDGRVTKAEGNPVHPINKGGLCPRGQASLQGQYDPARLKTALKRDGNSFRQSGWAEAFAGIGATLKGLKGRAVVVSDIQTGALAHVMSAFTGAFGQNGPLFYEAFGYDALRDAHGLAFGMPVVPRYRLDECDFIISFAADFLETWVSPVEFARQFAVMHSYKDGDIGRMAYVGPMLSMTAANADEFIMAAPGEERLVALMMLKVMQERGWAKNSVAYLMPQINAVLGRNRRPKIPEEKITALAEAFSKAKASVALAGPSVSLSPLARDASLAAALLNFAAGRLGQTVDFSSPHALSGVSRKEDVSRALTGLTKDDVLIIHNANPAYSYPPFAKSISKAGTVIYIGSLMDETANLADWVLAADYPLETWGDYEPYPGVRGMLQPAMARLYGTMNPGDIFMEMAKASGRPLAGEKGAAKNFEEWLKESWRVSGDEWHERVRVGGRWEETKTPARAMALKLSELSFAPPAKRETLQLWAWPSIMLFDGRLANRGWMQEVPDPVSVIIWGSWIDVHPETAKSLGIEKDELVRISTSAGTVEAPARPTHDVMENVVALAFGQGHTAMGPTAKGCGVSAFLLVSESPQAVFAEAKVSKTGRFRKPVYLAPTRSQEGRDLLQHVTLEKLRPLKPGEGTHLIMPLPEGYRKDKDLYQPHFYQKHRWAMAIDLQKCIGCQACAVACYAENNLPVMGAQFCNEGREMAWLKVEPYFLEGIRQRRLAWLPLPCQQCDAAPCEPVCPVFAAVHNEEGLNSQIYNRCIGTRYCSNNCPYKVRRFNWLNVKWNKPLDWQLNPEVTVRVRGVMEKCTFCVQRIRQAEYRAIREKRKIKDGEIQPACVQSCPTRVFTFGDLLDPDSEVSRITREDPRRYHVLEELNTKPAIAYLRKIIA